MITAHLEERVHEGSDVAQMIMLPPKSFSEQFLDRYGSWLAMITVCAIGIAIAILIVYLFVLAGYDRYNDTKDFITERRSWNQAVETKSFQDYLTDYGDEAKHRDEAVDGILKERKVTFVVVQSYTGMPSLFGAYQLPIERRLRDICFAHDLKGIEVRVTLRGKGLTAHYQKAGKVTSGAAMTGTITFNTLDGQESETITIDVESKPVSSIHGFSGHYTYAKQAFSRILKEHICTPVTNLAAKWQERLGGAAENTP